MTDAREEFEKWCPIKILDANKAPRAAALVKAYWTAWQAAYAAGQREMRERAAQEALKNTLDFAGEQIAEAIRALEES